MSLDIVTTSFAPLNTRVDSDRNYSDLAGCGCGGSSLEGCGCGTRMPTRFVSNLSGLSMDMTQATQIIVGAAAGAAFYLLWTAFFKTGSSR